MEIHWSVSPLQCGLQSKIYILIKFVKKLKEYSGFGCQGIKLSSFKSIFKVLSAYIYHAENIPFILFNNININFLVISWFL